ncbi:PhzF family phenazine biosynthesis protein [Microbacterium sp.]|uniref:PhzF family phenazine biosynthesis protein n=1 Tax=Microbacterium sp. TaxID=51671 RepID=UPI001AD1AAAC|nr:PhzF family phenazine biosynthesis protein [Microbacterium sp.]MBN9157779.1 PhzF family phenazine biosynthesis isomerase [Microbacterium sp.]MBS1900868.1 PhzF family phenazine biosynthesis isomerase [Actinomycetota bacterium]
MSAAPEILRYAAFAAAPEGGNPAGIVLDAGALTDADMQRIAAEVGYPETAFLLGRSDEAGERRYRIRYWSPAAEVPFCGHATVATAVLLAEREGDGDMTFETPVGDVALTASTGAGGIEVAFTSVEPVVRELDPGVLARLLEVLSLRAEDLDPAHPARESFAGNWHPVLVLRDPEIFHQFRFAPEPVAALMRERGWTGTITVLHPVAGGELLARNLFPVGRITEDPATGSAAAATGAYLRAIDRVPEDRVMRIHQGAHVGRPSLLTVTIPEVGGIVVTGGATPIRG